GYMAVVAKDCPSAGVETRPAEQELIRNGNFKEPPTSGAEAIANGGLGTAAWQPVREQLGDTADAVGSAKIISESLPGNIMAAVISRSADPGARYARVGIRQDINAPAPFLNRVELRARVKVVSQTE